MSVYDKELIIDGKAVRSPEQQVYKNMKDIQALQLKIKEAYKCAGELNTASISVAKSLTNAGEDVKEGWLLDTVGNLFSITGGDEDSLLLDFYCSIRGPQGDTGPAGTTAISDGSIALDSTWSSQRIVGVLQSEMDYATTRNTIFYTKTTPTLNGDYYELTRADLLNPQSVDERNYIAKQLILLDNDDKVKEIYSIEQFEETPPYTLKLTKRGTFGGGKQLYKHNVLIYKNGTRYYDYLFIDNMITDSPTAMTYSDVLSYLGDNGYVYDNNKAVYQQNEYAMRGWSYDSNNSTYTWYVGVMKVSNSEIKTHGMTGDGTINISSGWTIVDKVSTL